MVVAGIRRIIAAVNMARMLIELKDIPIMKNKFVEHIVMNGAGIMIGILGNVTIGMKNVGMSGAMKLFMLKVSVKKGRLIEVSIKK